MRFTLRFWDGLPRDISWQPTPSITDVIKRKQKIHSHQTFTSRHLSGHQFPSLNYRWYQRKQKIYFHQNIRYTCFSMNTCQCCLFSVHPTRECYIHLQSVGRVHIGYLTNVPFIEHLSYVNVSYVYRVYELYDLYKYTGHLHMEREKKKYTVYLFL